MFLSLLPGLFWMAYLRSLSRERKGGILLWIWAFVLGGASTQLTLFLSPLLGVDALKWIPYVGSLFFFVFGVGLVEEFCKSACAIVGLALPGSMKDPLVALQLTGGVALGFATVENVIYALNYGEGVLVGRALLSTLGHVLMSAVWGFSLGFLKESGGRLGYLKFLFLSALAHGLYDWFLSSNRPVLAILVLCLLWFGFREATLEAFLRQEYERELPYETRTCESCRVLTRADGAYCSLCGCAEDSDEGP